MVENIENEIRVTSLSKMRRENEDTDTSTYGVRGFSFILSEM